MDFTKNKYNPVYSTSQETLIKSEFNRTKGQCYLDNAGATLYSEHQIRNITQDLTTNLYANPHSQSSPSKTTKDSVDVIRLQCLKQFNADPEEYSLIFTSGATGALRLVAEIFDYQDGSFAYLEDNHTSVLGMREYSTNINVIKVKDAWRIFSLSSSPQLEVRKSTGNSLFVYPAQCNFSGTKYPLSWIDKIHNGVLNSVCASKDWYCLLDAAAFVSTNELDLSKYKPDFVCVSFYKIFGYPTGLGALLVRKGRSDVLVKRYYGGGTVFMTMSTENIVKPKTILHERFEDGTIQYLSILSLKHGFDTFKRLKLNMELISEHTFGLAQFVYGKLRSLRHTNGAPVAVLYHDTSFDCPRSQGAIVNFNLLRSNGDYIGYAEVCHIANLFGVHIRTGCFCNPGACQRHLRLSSQDVFEHFQKGHVCGDQHDLIDGVPTGSIRISFGYMTTKEEVDEFLCMIEDCFVSKPAIREPGRHILQDKESRCKNAAIPEEVCLTGIIKETNSCELTSTLNIKGTLESIFLYPVKSCGFFEVKDSWKIVKTGLRYDREWMITNSTGVCMTQKLNTNLCKIKPKICMDTQSLEISYQGKFSEKLPLIFYRNENVKVFPCQSKVCNDPVVAWDCGQSISSWLQSNLEISGMKLMRQCPEASSARKKLERGESVQLSLANQAQFLLVNRKSVEWLSRRIGNEFTDTVDGLIRRFRPNFVVNFEEPFVENDIKEFRINNLIFKNVGKCTRCQMICINQATGEKTVEPLRTLSKELKGKISFGVYLKYDFCDTNDNRIFVDSHVVGYY